MNLPDNRTPQTGAKFDHDKTRLPDLDGFRAISIGLVLGAHCANISNFPHFLRGKWPFDGDLGVRFFFVISGFIITWILLNEGLQNDRVSLRNFWLRRAVRILPACGALFLALAVLEMTTSWHMSAAAWIGALTFSINYTECPWLPSHLWSLAVEEQFYLLWPLAFVTLKPWRGPRKSTVFLAVIIVTCAFYQWIGLHSKSLFLAGHSFLLRQDSIAFGCMGAILLLHYRARLAGMLQRHRALVAGLTMATILIPRVVEVLLHATREFVPGLTAIQGFGLMSTLLWSQIEPNAPTFRFLQWKPFVMIGLWSYSIYLWQQIFCGNAEITFGFQSVPWWLDNPGWLVPSFFCAITSYYLIEQPIRTRFKAWRARISLPTLDLKPAIH